MSKAILNKVVSGVEEKTQMKLPHNVVLEDRKHLSISGVMDIDNFDEQTAVVYTQMGELTIRGYDLHVSKLNVETGELSMDGEIWSMTYTEVQKKNGGMLSKLFR